MSSRTSEMFEFNKMILIYTLTVLILSVWIIHYILHRPKLYIPLLVYIFLLFLLTQSISTVFSIDQHTSIFGYYGRWNGGLISIVSYFVLFFVFIQTFRAKDIISFLRISLFSSLIVILWGMPAKFGGDLSCLLFTGNLTNACWTAQFQPAVRMFSTLGQPNWLGSYLAIHFFVGIYFFLNSFQKVQESILTVSGIKERILEFFHIILKHKESNVMNYFYGGYMVLVLLGLLFTKSRSSLLAVGLSMAIGIVILITSNLKGSLKMLYRTVLIVALLFTSYYIVSFSSARLPADIPEHLQITDSFQIRKIVWQGAVNLGISNPLFGTGPETFAYAYYFERPLAHNLTSEWDFVYNKAHNEFLNYFATTGFIGFGAYLLFIGVSIYYFLKAIEGKKPENSLLSFTVFLAYVSILITNFFGFSTSTIQLFFYIAPGIAYLLTKKETENNVKGKVFSFLTKMQSVIILIVGFYMLSLIMSYYQADRLYKQAQESHSQDDYQNSSRLYMEAINLKYEHVYEDKLSTALAHLAFISSFDADTQNTSEFIQLSRDSNSNTLKISHNNLQYWRTKAKNNYLYYQITGDIEDLKKAVDSMRYTTIIAPTDAQSFYMLGLFYSLMDQEVQDEVYKQKAIKSIEYAIELRPNFIEAQELLQQVMSE